MAGLVAWIGLLLLLLVTSPVHVAAFGSTHGTRTCFPAPSGKLPYRTHFVHQRKLKSSFCALRLGNQNENIENKDDEREEGILSNPATKIIHDYWSLLRPVTLIQAVGAWIVGRLVVLRASTTWTSLDVTQELCAILVVYLSYGVGMVANDCVDAKLDASTKNTTAGRDFDHDKLQTLTPNTTKRQRAIASGRITVQQGWIWAGILSTISLLVGYVGVSRQYAIWSCSNLALMFLYSAGGIQNVLLLKNILVGWLCISPLWGARTLQSSSLITAPTEINMVWKTKMNLLALAGFAVGVIREVLKDCQDVELDRGTKSTLPLLWGVEPTRRICMLALGGTLAVLQTPLYRRLFAATTKQKVPIYSMAWWAATVLCLLASWQKDIDPQQALVKKSIYVLLIGLIGSMAVAS